MIPLLFLLCSFQLSGQDGAVVMLSGVPAEPWESLSDSQLEQMWTYGIEGYQVLRSGWSGYLLRGPDGTAPVLSSLCETLVTDSLVPDSSLWGRTLQLVWNSNALPGFTVIESELSDIPPMPVRTSRWLESGADTLILSLPVSNTLLFWSGGYSGDFHLASWRGIGTEVIPAGNGGFSSLVSSAISGSPEDIIHLEYASSPVDFWWGDTWAPLLSAADSIVMGQMASGQQVQNSLIWIRGTGGQPLQPWTMIPSPPPPVIASHTVVSLPGVIPSTEFPSEMEGTVTVEMPGNAGSVARAAYAAALLERIVARMALPRGAVCRGRFAADASVSLQIAGVGWSREEALDLITEELTPIIFTAPETELMNNAAVKAGIPVMDQRETVELLAVVSGFLRE